MTQADNPMMTAEEWQRQAAQARVAKRRIVTGVCDHCGASFTGITLKRFCSGRCKTAFYRAASVTETKH